MPDHPRPVFEYRLATEEDIAWHEAEQEDQVQVWEAPFPMTDRTQRDMILGERLCEQFLNQWRSASLL